MKETDDKIVVFGDHNFRYDIPKSKIIAVILYMNFPEILRKIHDRRREIY